MYTFQLGVLLLIFIGALAYPFPGYERPFGVGGFPGGGGGIGGYPGGGGGYGYPGGIGGYPGGGIGGYPGGGIGGFPGGGIGSSFGQSSGASVVSQTTTFQQSQGQSGVGAGGFGRRRR
ncbi:hypothetical protein TELCIR_02427 [Teladorsagia circumcincta]|uniref:Uncharacterized protein n=1 Tax=Teladorsagia circumcincta TaxID=45464 RepID=A0A2G9UZ79_TELCI|nr:hypothetical protein TELCIR_02427 [Teladorsagia circumcincta]